MLYEDLDRLGEEIKRTVENAVDSRNFYSLNQTITNTVNQAAEGVRKFSEQSYHKREDYNIPPLLFKRTKGVKVQAIVMTIIGAIVLGTLFFPFVLSVLEAVFTSGFVAVGGVLLASLFGVLLTAGAILLGYGIHFLKKIKRFQVYIEELGTKEYFEIGEVSKRLKKSPKYVLSDLNKMIEKKWFLQGHIDLQQTCFIASHEMYNQYHNMMRQVEQQKKEQAKEQARQEENQKAREKLDPQVQDIIKAGDMYVSKIKACNDRIPGKEISAKISKIEYLINQIFERVEQNPGCVSDIRRLMDYYLPTTVKLLEAYAELDCMSVQGENILSSKKEIESTIDTLNEAFTKLLDSLFQEKAWDVSADISVLNTMLAQEGLTKNDF